MIKHLFAGVGFAALLATSAFAQPPAPPAPAPLTRAQADAKAVADFRQADANHDGFVTRAEWYAFRDEQRAQEEAKRRDEHFNRLDRDHNGSISRAEFDAPPPPPAPGGPPPAPGKPGGPGKHGRPGEHGPGPDHRPDGPRMEERFFDRADTNHDGKLTLAEARAAAMARFDRMDANHDGTITPDEHRAAGPRHGPDGAPPPPVD